MKRVPVTPEQALDLITSGGAVLMFELQHDTWCRTLKTGNGNDCNCNPDQQFFHYLEDEQDALGGRTDG